MNGGYEKLNPRELIGLEGHQTLLNSRLIEVGVRLAVDFLSIDTGAIAERVVFAQVVLVQYFENRDTPRATKGMALPLNRGVIAGLAAMKTGNLYFCRGY